MTSTSALQMIQQKSLMNVTKTTPGPGSAEVLRNVDPKLLIDTLPGDMKSDLRDAFDMYDTDSKGQISPADFRVILANFGFQKLTRKEQEDEIMKFDVHYKTREFFDFDYLRFVVNFRWDKKPKEKGRDLEADDAFNLFDVKGKEKILESDLKQVLSEQLDF